MCTILCMLRLWGVAERHVACSVSTQMEVVHQRTSEPFPRARREKGRAKRWCWSPSILFPKQPGVEMFPPLCFCFSFSSLSSSLWPFYPSIFSVFLLGNILSFGLSGRYNRERGQPYLKLSQMGPFCTRPQCVIFHQPSSQHQLTQLHSNFLPCYYGLHSILNPSPKANDSSPF